MSSLDSPISEKDDSVGSIKRIVRETIQEALIEAVNSIDPVIICSGDIIDGKVVDLGNNSGTVVAPHHQDQSQF